MRYPKTFCLLALLALMLAATAPALAQKSSSKKKASAADDEKAQQEAMMKAATPGEEHKMLAASAGSWKTATKMWVAPGQPPVESTGESVITSVLGGRFIEEHAKGDMMGMAFEGMGLTGYDNVSKKYIGTWADNFGTVIILMTGTYDAKSKTMTMTGKYADPMTGKVKTLKMTSHSVSDSSHVSEFYDEVSPGKFAKIMELTYTRQ